MRRCNDITRKPSGIASKLNLVIRGLTPDSKLRKDHDSAIEDVQRQLQHVKRTTEGDADRIRRRTEAEISDFRSRIAELEAELEKVISIFYFK